MFVILALKRQYISHILDFRFFFACVLEERPSKRNFLNIRFCYFSTEQKATDPPTEEGFCPGNDWIPWISNCYLFLPNHFVSWKKGQEECRKKGGHLASVHSERENSFVYRNMYNGTTLPFHRDLWIGYNKGENKKKSMFILVFLCGFT